MKPWKRIFLTFFFFIFSTDIYPIITNFLSKRKEKSSPKIESNNESLRTKKEHPTYFLLSPSSTLPYRSPITTPFLHPLSLQIERILGQKPSINRTNPFFSSQRCFEFSRLKSKERKTEKRKTFAFSLALSGRPLEIQEGEKETQKGGQGEGDYARYTREGVF